MKVLAVIPARGGSKGIPRKNLALLGGRPLLFYTGREARKARSLDRIVVSTDDSRVAAAARRMGIEVPFMRPKRLSSDRAAMVDVLKHALVALRRLDGYAPDAVVVLQPTSPFRRARHIDQAVAALRDARAQTAVTVVQIPHNMSPESALSIHRGMLRPVKKGAPTLRRQDKKIYVARNGPAVLAVRTSLITSGRLYGAKVAAVPMAALESIDIDGPEDFKLAEALFRSSKLFR